MMWRRGELGVFSGVVLVAAAYFALGCTRSLEWIDEGQIVYPSWRVSEGAVAYRDFQHLYGPSVFFLNGALFRHFGADLFVVRVSLVILKSITAGITYLLARQVAAPVFAALAAACLIAVWGAPWWLFNTPYANHYALTLDVAGLLLFLGVRHRFHLGCGLAGFCFGVAATFKQTSGVFAMAAFALFAVLVTQSEDLSGETDSRSSSGGSRVLRGMRLVVLVGTIGLFVVYLSPRNSAWNVLLLLAPAVATAGGAAFREGAVRSGSPGALRGLSGIACALAGMAIPLIACGGYFGAAGLLSEFLFNTVTDLPRVMRWFVPYPKPDLRTVLCSAVVLGALVSVRLWGAADQRRGGRPAALLATAALGVATAWLVQDIDSRGGVWAYVWSNNWQGDVIRLWFVLPLATVWLSCVLLWRWGRHPVLPHTATAASNGPAVLLFHCHAVVSLLFFYPAADFWHVVMALPAFLPLLAHLLDRFCRAAGGNGPQRPWQSASGALLGALVTIMVAPPIVALVTACRQPRPATAPLIRATHITGAPPKFGEVAALVNFVESRFSQHRDLLVLTGEQMLYFLTGRRSALESREFVLYLVATGLIADEEARNLAGESEMIGRLAAARPVIIDAVDSPAVERFRNVFPTVARYMDNHYRPVQAIGTYRALDWAQD